MNFVSITISYWRFFFQCEICHLAKHIHSTHHSQKYKVSSHFSLVHSDIWGLSQVKHLMEKKNGLSHVFMVTLGFVRYNF